jgi:hypothetical protein
MMARLFLLLFLFYFQIGFGQNGNNYFFLGVGTSLYTLGDSTVSPMTYRGIPFPASIGLEINQPKALNRLVIAGDAGKLQSANATSQRPMRK